MKKNIRLVALLLVIFALSACSSFPKPEKTVRLYLDSAKKFDFETMKTLIASEEYQEQHSKMANNTDEGAKNFMDYLRECAPKIEYTIFDSEIKEETATVKVFCKYVDGGVLMKDVIYEVIKGTLTNAITGGKELTEEENEQLYVEAINNILPNIEEKMIEQTIDVTLHKTETGWIIDGGEEELYNVAMANFMNASKELIESFNQPGGNKIQVSMNIEQ